MRPEHKEAFFLAAQQFTCWIGLREPNPLADRWIGRPGYAPKPEECKAKTADNPAHRLAGLVVDPVLCPQAFKADTRQVAVEKWQKAFLTAGRLPGGFTRIEHGPDAGLVKYQGAALFADFDLMAINRSNARGEFLQTSNEEEEQLFALVQPELNRRLGAPMIQHGAEFMWDKGVGAREFEYVLWFGPGRRFNRWPSSMPTKSPH
jgi:hypothetical protein